LLGWLSGSEPRLAQSQNAPFSFRGLGEAAMSEGGCGQWPDFASYTLAFALQLRKITENLSQGSRKALDRSAPNAIRLVDLAIATPAGPCRPWLSRQVTGSTLGQLKYLPSRRTRGSPTSPKFESKLAAAGNTAKQGVI